MTIFHDVMVVEPGGTNGPVLRLDGEPGPGAVVLTSADALNWIDHVLDAGPTGALVWPHAAGPIYACGDGFDDAGGTSVVVMLAGGPSPDGTDLQPEWCVIDDALSSAIGHPVMRIGAPVGPTLDRMIGEPGLAGRLLDETSTFVTIAAGATSTVAAELAGHVGPAAHGVDGLAAATAAAAWTRHVPTFHLAAEADGTSATVLVGDAGRARAADLIGAGAGFDIVGAAEVGGRTTALTDLATWAGALGGGGFAGDATPERPVLIVRGEAGRLVRATMPAADVDPNEWSVIQPAPGEDGERFMAHQWASMARMARLAKEQPTDAGGPTLTSEAAEIGFIGLDDDTAAVGIDLLSAIATARGWHEIDPELPPILDPALAHAHAQICGDDTPMPTAILAALGERCRAPGFWVGLSAAVMPVTGPRLVFPYPPSAVDILRTAVAAGGDAERLRELVGPVKVSILSAFGGDDA